VKPSTFPCAEHKKPDFKFPKKLETEIRLTAFENIQLTICKLWNPLVDMPSPAIKDGMHEGRAPWRAYHGVMACQLPAPTPF
jgi:hypothetical protein